MAGVATEESELGRSFEGFSSGQQLQLCQSGEALAEWRSSEQVENGSPSTSPPYWDSDEDDDGALKPSDLYGKYTWKIDKFSQVNKRELRSNAFEVGGYKWYILIYPQGCDVCNHLSLFLCVANHDKLLPGWSHFAQFTIAVVNKDPKKSKYSGSCLKFCFHHCLSLNLEDTLHRFWKKEHDWGWKKFMELSKVLDGFLDDDTLIIKAQVQVIRERVDRPFWCLDRQYRRELVRVYLTNVEQICRRFVEERRGKLVKLIDDKSRWSSFCAFWLGMDQSSRRLMSQERTELILKIIVKHFFIEKEVTSTLVMDALYSGLKALEGQNQGKKNKGKFLEADESPIPIVCIEKDTFVLVDDVLLLLGRAAMEPLPPKEDKGPQNRTKDVTAGEEFNKDSFERDERRLTELGRRTIEIFVLAHIFSKIEVAYQEAVALKKQEELIREEEAAWLAELEQKARRGAADKEKKSKKKQGKQKRNNRKGKEKGKDDRSGSLVQDKVEQDRTTVERKDSAVETEMTFGKSNAVEDGSDVSDSVDCVPEILPPESDDRAASPVSCDTDTLCPTAESSSCGISGLSGVQIGIEGRSSSVVDDSSSTCSSDSVPFVVMHKGNSHYRNNQKYPHSGHNQQHKQTSERVDWEEPSVPSEFLADARHRNSASQSSSPVGSLTENRRSSQESLANGAERQIRKKEEETYSCHRNSNFKDAVVQEVPADGTACRTSPPTSPSKSISSIASPKPDCRTNAPSDAVVPKKQLPDNPKVNNTTNTVHSSNSAGNTTMLKPDAPKSITPKPAGHQLHAGREKAQVQEVAATADKPSIPLIPVVSRPSSAPLVPGLKPAVSVAPMVQAAPVLSRSVSATGRLGPEAASASATPSFVPQSYRNAIMGGLAGGSSSVYPQSHSASSVVNPALVSAPLFSPHVSDRMDPNPSKPSLSFGMANHHNILQNGPVWVEQPQRDINLNLSCDRGSLMNDAGSFNLYNPVQCRSQDHLPAEFPAGTSGRQGHVLPDEFPHLDIINELLDDEHGLGLAARINSGYQNFNNGPQSLNRHYSFPGDPAMSAISSGLGMSQSSCRFDRTHSYHDDLLQQGYGTSRRAYDMLGDMIPQSSPQLYPNGCIDGYLLNQWQIPGSNMPFLSVGPLDDPSYPYHMPEYQNLNSGVNGYTVFRQSNGL